MSDEFPKVHDISWGDEDDQFCKGQGEKEGSGSLTD